MKAKVVILPEVHKKIMHWVNKSEYEVSGLGKIRRDGDTFYVMDAILLPQKNGTGHTDIEAEHVGKAMFEMRQVPGDLRWWWHSHVNMGVFWSGQDKETMQLAGAGGWILASVFNKKYEIRSAFYSIDGYTLPWGKFPILVDELETTVARSEHPKEKEWDAEYEKNVTNTMYKGVTVYSGGGEFGRLTVERNSTTTGAGTAKTTATSTGSAKVFGSDGKPLTKKQLKKLKKEARKAELEAATKEEPADRDIPPWDIADGEALPFEPDELNFFASHGITPDEVEAMSYISYFTVNEIIDLVRRGHRAEEILAMDARLCDDDDDEIDLTNFKRAAAPKGPPPAKSDGTTGGVG